MGTRRTHTNSQGTSMQPPAGPSTSTVAPTLPTLSAPPALAKSHLQHMKFDLQPLNDNGSNYSQWCKMIILMLKYKGLWTIVDGSLPAPVLTDT